MAISPAFYNKIILKNATLSAANANYDGTGTLVTLYTAAGVGAKIEKIRLQATGATTLGSVNLFIDSGAGAEFFKSIAIAAGTRLETEVTLNLILEPGQILKASTVNAEEQNIFTSGGEY